MAALKAAGICVIAVFLVLFGWTQAYANHDPEVQVIDGDTFRVVKYEITVETFRLVGYDTPEIFRPKCKYEKELGLKAKERLKEILAEGAVNIERQKGRDKYGRSLAKVTIFGTPVGERLVAEGLAVRMPGKKRTQNWCEGVTEP